MVYERQSVVNLSFSFRTPSTSSYLLPGLMVRYGERRQKTTNHDNENSNREIKDEFSLSWLVVCYPLPVSIHDIINPGKRRWNVAAGIIMSCIERGGVENEKERPKMMNDD